MQKARKAESAANVITRRHPTAQAPPPPIRSMARRRPTSSIYRDQVKPFITTRHRADPAKAIFLGHSYGALLGTQILFTEPDMFSSYILAARRLVRQAIRLEARSALRRAASGLEGECLSLCRRPRGLAQRRPALQSRRWTWWPTTGRWKRRWLRKHPGLKLKSAVLNDEDHLTVAPRGFTQGLKYLLPVR